MEFQDKKKRRKKKKNISDRLIMEKADRRLLSHVPDETGKRTNNDRRGYDAEKKQTYEEYMLEKNTGIRYITGMDVKVKSLDKGVNVTCKGVIEDISNKGMLVEFSEEDYNALLKSDYIKVSFRVSPGSMPEGYEMRVKQKANIVRRFRSEDGHYLYGIAFTKELHHYAAVNKDRYMFTAAALLIAFSVACIILMRAESIIYFKFNKMLYLYSLITAVFLLSRYIFGAIYRPKKIDPDFTPGVSILIPCFNEEEWIHRTITSCINQEYPLDKLEVIVVDDCSTDKSVEKIKETIERIKRESPVEFKIDERLSYYVQPKNAGKREALVVGAMKAKHDLVVFVDSDSFLDPFAIRNLVQPFKDPKMGGVSGRTDVANTYTNALTKMQAVRYYVAFRVMKAAEGLFDCVTCLSGPLSCYRKEIILEKKDAWLNQRFLGQKATFGDDRSMTNFVLREHRATYQDTAVCSTIVPNRHAMFLKQQMRWKRSWLRESLIAATFMWKKEPFAAVTFYMGLVVPIAAPIVVIYNLVYVPFTQHIFPTSFVLGLFLMSMLMSMAQLLLRKSSTWIYGMLFCIYYELVLLWQMPIAWFTFWKSTWGTRMTPEDIKAAERKFHRRLLRNKKFITPAELASVLGITEEDVLDQMQGGRFQKYIVEVNGKQMLKAIALKDFYDDVQVTKTKSAEEVIFDENADLKDNPEIANTAASPAEAVTESIIAEEPVAGTAEVSETIAVAETAADEAEIIEAAEAAEPVVHTVTESSANAGAVTNESIDRIEARLNEVINKLEEEKQMLLAEIRKKDALLERREDQLDELIRGIKVANDNTGRVIDWILSNNGKKAGE